MMLFVLCCALACAAPVCPAVSFAVTSSWTGGYVAAVALTAAVPVPSWSVTFAVPSGTTIASVWNAVLRSSTASSATIAGPDWATTLSGSISPGFQAAGSAWVTPGTVLVSDGTVTVTCPVSASAATTSSTVAPTTTTRVTAAPSVAPLDSVGRFRQWLDVLTTMEGTGTQFRAVHSSGGAAGGVVSEGQAYGLAMAGFLSASCDPWVVARADELYRGWKRMCSLSGASGSCQSFYCGNNSYPCLPHWKFDDRISAPLGTGSATDGDEDAMLGLILLAKATAATPSLLPVTPWAEISDAATQTCRAFLDFNTGSGGIVKLGSCWGGWSCVNPSYLYPAAYKACRDWMPPSYAARWNAVIDTTYALLSGSSCSYASLVPNWVVPNQASPSSPGSTSSSCQFSGTPAAQFGAEASRYVYRAAVDWALYRDSNAAALLTPISNWMSQAQPQLPTGCLVTSIFPDWSNNAFIWAPLLTSQIVASPTAANLAKLGAATITDYYAGSWVALATVVLAGDVKSVGSTVPPTTVLTTTTVVPTTTTTTAMTTTAAPTTSTLRATTTAAPTPTTIAPTTTRTTTVASTTTTPRPTTVAPSTTSRASTTAPSSGSVCAAVSVASSWNGGFQAEVVVTAGATPLADWSIQVNLGSAATLSGPPWSGDLVAASSTPSLLVITAPAWQRTLAAYASITVGFNAAGSSSTMSPSAPVSFTGSNGFQSCGGVTPATSVAPVTTTTTLRSTLSSSLPTTAPSAYSGRTTVYFQMTSIGYLTATTAQQSILSLLPDTATRSYTIVLTFACAQSGGTLKPDGAAGSFATFVSQPDAAKQFVAQLRSTNRRVVVAVGGAKGYSTGFEYLNTAQEIATFASSLKAFVDQFSFDGVDLDFEELEGVAKSDPSYTSLQQKRLAILRAIRSVMPRPYLLSVALWSIGGCTGALCPQFVGNTNAGMDLPVLQDATIVASIDAFLVMSYYTGLESNPTLQMQNTVAAVASWGIAPSRVFGGVMGGGQYTVVTAGAYAALLRQNGFNAFLWDLSSQTSPLVAVL